MSKSPKKLDKDGDNGSSDQGHMIVDDDPLSNDLMFLMNREKIPISLVRIKEPIVVSVFKSAYSEDRRVFKENNQQQYNPHFQPEDAFLVNSIFYDAPISNQLIGILDIFTTVSSRANYTCEAEFNKRVMEMFADLEKKFAAEERAKALAEGRVEFDTPASPKNKKKEKVEYIEPFELRILPIVHCSLFKIGESNHVNVCVSRGSNAALWASTPNNSPSISPTSSPSRSPLHTREGLRNTMDSNVSPPGSSEGRDRNNTVSRGDGNRASFSNSISPHGSREGGRMSPTVSRDDKVRLSSGLLDEFGFATQPFLARKIPPKDYNAKVMKLNQVVLESRNVSSRNMLKWATQIYSTLIALARNYISFNGEVSISDVILIPDKCVLQSLRESQLKVTGPRDVLDKIDPNAPKRKMNKAEKQRILKEKRKVKAYIKAEEEEIMKIKESRFDRDAWIDPDFCLSKLGTIQKLKQKSKFVNVQDDDMSDLHGFVDEEDESTDDSTVESTSTDNDNIDNDSIGQNSQSSISLQSLNTKYALAKVQKDASFKFPSKFTLLNKYDNTQKVATCVVNHYDTIPKVSAQYNVFFNGIVKDMRSLGIILIQIIMRTVFEPNNNLLKQLKSSKLYYDELIKLITFPKLDDEIVEFLQLCFMEPDPIEVSERPDGTIFKSTYLETCFEMVDVFKEKLKNQEENTKFVKQSYWTSKEEKKMIEREQKKSERSAANVVFGLQMAEKRNTIEKYRNWFEVQPENVKRRILHKRAARKQTLINKEVRRKGIYQSLFHWWGESETCFWIQDALTVCMRDAQDLIKMTFQKGLGLPSPHASRAVTPNSRPASRASSPKKKDRAMKKPRAKSPDKAKGKRKGASNSSEGATTNTSSTTIIPSNPPSRANTAKTNKKLNVKFNLVQKQRIKDVVIPVSDCMEKVLIFYRIGCKSRRGGATFDDLQEDNNNVVMTLARELSVGITGLCSCMEITKSIRAAREYAADKFSKSIMLSMLPEMQYKVKKLATESEHMVENCTALLTAAKFIANSVGIVDKFWPRKIALMCCIAIIEKYDKQAPSREKGLHLASHKVVALMRGIVIREKVAQIWYQADKEYEAILAEEDSHKAEILDENNEVIIIEKIDEELEQPNVIKVDGKDNGLTVTISINLPLCNFGPGGRQRSFISVKGILAKQPLKLPDLQKGKTLRKEFSKPLPYDNTDTNIATNTSTTKSTSQYNGSIVLIMYDKRQNLPIDEEFLKYHEAPDNVKLRVTITYIGPKPLPSKRRSSFDPLLDEIKPSDTDLFAINIEGLDAYKSYRIQVLMGDIFKAVQKYERNYFIRDIKLVQPTVIQMHERKIVGITKPGVPETPTISGIECVFSTAIGTGSESNTNTRSDMLIKVGPRALPYVNAVTRMRWDSPYCNGSRLLRYKIQKRYIITANPNAYSDSNPDIDTNTRVISIPNDDLESISLVKGSWKTAVLLPGTANAYTDIVHLPHEIDVDAGYILDRHMNTNANANNTDDGNDDPFSIFIQYRVRAITKVGPGDYSQPITSGQAIIAMTTSLKKLRMDDDQRDLRTLRNSILNIDNDDVSVLSADTNNNNKNEKNNYDCGIDGDLISISGNSHNNSVISSSKLKLRQRSTLETTTPNSPLQSKRSILTEEQFARIKRLEEAWNTDLDVDNNTDNDNDNSDSDSDDFNDYHVQPVHGTFPKRHRRPTDEQLLPSNMSHPSVSRRIDDHTKALMTLSPSLKKVNDVIADDAILHHKWDKKANVIDDALIKEMDKLSRVKLDNHPSFNDDANSKKWWKRQEVMMMMDSDIKNIGYDDDNTVDTTSIHTNNIQVFKPPGKYKIKQEHDDNDESSVTEPIDDWIAKLQYKSPFMQSKD